MVRLGQSLEALKLLQVLVELLIGDAGERLNILFRLGSGLRNQGTQAGDLEFGQAQGIT